MRIDSRDEKHLELWWLSDGGFRAVVEVSS